MASPQTENGHVRIANELMEHLARAHLLGSDLAAVLFVIRKTYGFNKTMDEISISQIALGIDLEESTVSKIKRRLFDAHILVTDGRRIGIQKDWELWTYTNPLARNKAAPPHAARGDSPRGDGGTHAAQGLPTRRQPPPHAAPENLPTRRGTQKTERHFTKDSIAGDAEHPHAARGVETKEMHQQIVEVFDVFRTTVNPTIQFGHKTNRTAAETLIKKYGAAEAVKVAQYACSVQGQKYAPVITTPHELLMKLGQLGVYLKRERGDKPSVLTL